jgi:hypothetical protein
MVLWLKNSSDGGGDGRGSSPKQRISSGSTGAAGRRARLARVKAARV